MNRNFEFFLLIIDHQVIQKDFSMGVLTNTCINEHRSCPHPNIRERGDHFHFNKASTVCLEALDNHILRLADLSTVQKPLESPSASWTVRHLVINDNVTFESLFRYKFLIISNFNERQVDNLCGSLFKNTGFGGCKEKAKARKINLLKQCSQQAHLPFSQKSPSEISSQHQAK